MRIFYNYQLSVSAYMKLLLRLRFLTDSVLDICMRLLNL